MKIQDKLKELENSINSIKDAMFAEIDRRADKEWCLQDRCDFTVTIAYEDYKELNDLEEEYYKLKRSI